MDAYLKMLLVDNYVHTDLHPGNIFICKQESQARRHLRLNFHNAAVPNADHVRVKGYHCTVRSATD